ncbi:MAG: shikimate dehydrogenase [Cyanobacteria bacterium P01_G01_bin.39]
MSNPIIETDLGQVLGQINQKLDNLSTDANDLKIGQARLEEKVSNLSRETTEIKSSIKEITDTQKTLTADIADLKGSKSLIVPIVVAVITSILTLLVRAIPIN